MQTDHDPGTTGAESGAIGAEEAGARGRVRLFCLPPAGAGAVTYRPWPRALPPWIVCHAVDLPGRERRLAEPAETKAEALVARLADELGADLAAPFALFGHSMGGLLAFELARELRRRGAPAPAALFVAAAPAPRWPSRNPPIHDLPRERLLDELAALGGTPPEVLANRDLMDLMLPTIRADLAICETWRYRAEAPLDMPILALAARADERCPPAAMRAWAAETEGDFALREYEGGHFFLRPHLDKVVALIASILAADRTAA